jgi:hypothetical protein
MTDILNRLSDPSKKGKSILSGSASLGFKGIGIEVSGKREPQASDNVTAP